MTDLREIFHELALTQYLDSFLEQGFDTWDTILDITESDFDALGVKLGHRRKLQRKIAATRGISNAQALASPRRGTPALEDKPGEESKGTTPKPEGKDEGSSTNQPSGKRKYRRHPKPDENAPERPPSAYVIFSNKMREDLRGRPLSFTEIAKLVGENWQNLTPSEKERYEQQAFSAKEKYTAELSEYRQTDNYRVYTEYLLDFKAKQLHQQEASQDSSNETSKRPKLESHSSGNSSNTTKSSSSSATGRDLSREASAGARARVASIGPISGPWFSGDPPIAQPGLLSMPKGHGSPIGPAGSLPVYRDTVIGPSSQPVTWKELTRSTEMPIHPYTRRVERNPTQPSILNAPDSPIPFAQTFHSHQRSIGGFTPPLLKSESTTSTLQSSTSSGSADSSYYGPRTPLDSSRDKPALTIPPIYPGQKLPGSFDAQLPPLQHRSLSPQAVISIYNPPSRILTDYASATPPGYFCPDRPRPPGLPQRNPEEEITPLDPVSALIRAGEIVNSQGRREGTAPLPQQQQQQQQRHELRHAKQPPGL